MSVPYQGRDLSNCSVGRLRVAINCGVLSVKDHFYWSLCVFCIVKSNFVVSKKMFESLVKDL